MITNLKLLNNQVPGNTYTAYFASDPKANSKKSSYFNHFLTKANRNNSINALMNETHQLIFACADTLGAMYDAAVYEHNLPTNFEGNLESKLESNSYFRRKRGIPILGEIISEITSIPGPQDWKAEISLRK